MHSILFYIGPVPIRAYGLMLWIGLLVGLFRTLRAARRMDIKPHHVIDAALYGVLAGIIGAHIVSVLLDLPYYRAHPSEIYALWKGILSPSGGLRGLSFHGGVLGALGAVYLYARRKGIRFLAMADLLAPGLAIGYAITRIGCFLNGCCYGIPTSLPWGVRFQLDPTSDVLTPPSHPVQLYAMAANILIFLALVAVERRRRFVGQVFTSYLILYSVYRFLVEFLRTAEVAFAWLTEAQVASLVVLLAAVPILVVSLRRPSSQDKVRTRRSAKSAIRPDGRASARNPSRRTGVRPKSEM